MDKLPDKGARDWTQALTRSKCPWPPVHLCSPVSASYLRWLWLYLSRDCLDSLLDPSGCAPFICVVYFPAFSSYIFFIGLQNTFDSYTVSTLHCCYLGFCSAVTLGLPVASAPSHPLLCCDPAYLGSDLVWFGFTLFSCHCVFSSLCVCSF